MDDFILVREHGTDNTLRDVFMIPLNESGTTEVIKVVDLADSAISNGIIFDGFRRSVIYSVGGIIKSLSIDGVAESTLADLSKYIEVCNFWYPALLENDTRAILDK